MVESIETVVVGAGHAGLAASYCLKQQGCEHIVLEKAGRPANSWHSERWDSFTFVTPNWTFQIPGGEYDGPDPEGFMTRAELVERLGRYALAHRLPIRYDTQILAIHKRENGTFQVHTQEKDFIARNVVAANGWFQAAKRPAFAEKLPAAVLQIHSSQYRNPEALPPGAVLVVGAGQSGAQIAEELYQSGHRVFLATGTTSHAPRRYRGRDIFHWMFDSGFADRTIEQMQFNGHLFVAPLISGKDGGHTLNLHQFYRDGVVLLGHARDLLDGRLILARDLKENLGKADAAQGYILKGFDAYIQKAGLDAPPDERLAWTDGYQAPEISELDLRAEKIGTVLWACGYRYDPSIFQFPVTDLKGLPDAPLGISRAHPGLYFVGFPFLPSLKSGFVAGAAASAARMAENIKERKSRYEVAG